MKKPTKQLKDMLTGLVVDAEAQEDELPVTWASHVLIPLAQNMVGGVFVAVAVGAVAIAVARLLDTRLDMADLQFWCIICGVMVCASATCVRFFGDDLGLIKVAYDAGVKSADNQINGLTAENQRLLATVREIRGQAPTHRATEKVEQIDNAQKDAEELLNLAHNRQPIAREKVSAWLPQRRWERAIQLMRAAGTLDGNSLADRNLGQSLAKLRAYTSTHKERISNGNYVAKWEVEAKH